MYSPKVQLSLFVLFCGVNRHRCLFVSWNPNVLFFVVVVAIVVVVVLHRLLPVTEPNVLVYARACNPACMRYI